MKKLAIASLCILTSFSAFSGQIDPMEGYEVTNVPAENLDRLWDSLRTDVKGKDCYRRAQLWSYEMFKRHNIKSRKIFIHYSDKFNRELDNLGRDGGLGWMSRKSLKIDGVSNRDMNMIRSNITWDYHVAPMLSVDGQDVVVDKYLSLPYEASYPYTDSEAWSLTNRAATPEEWVEALTVRGEILWKARRQELKNEIAKNTTKYRKIKSDARRAKFRSKIRDLTSQYKALGMDKTDSIDIKCRKVTSIAEADAARLSEWCFYSEVPMYYYNELDLRALAYGRIAGYSMNNYHSAIPEELRDEANYTNRENYVQTRFNDNELEDAQGEIKSTESSERQIFMDKMEQEARERRIELAKERD